MKEFILNILRGAIIGVANIIPGVSGGTMAVALGIYDKLVKIIGNVFRSVFKNFKKTMLFMVPLVIGAAGGVLGFSRVMEWLLTNYNLQTILLFAGLIIGTLPMIFRNATKQGFKRRYVIPAIVVLLFMISMLFISESTDVILDNNMHSYIMLFIYGFVAASSMVIPGISGSFVLMLMGAYMPILTLVNNMNILLLIPFGLGVIAGILICTKIIDICLEKKYGYTYFAIIGFIIGSLVLLPKEMVFENANILAGIICLVIGILISYFMSKLEKEEDINEYVV